MNFVHHLTVGRKLLLLGVLLLVTITVPLALQFIDAREAIVAADREREGLPAARALVKLVQATQQHRGLTVGMLNGNQGFAAPREAKQQEVGTLVAELAERWKQEGLPPAMEQTWTQTVQCWKEIEGSIPGGKMTPADALARHTQLIALQLKMIDLLLDRSGLILDSQAHTFYLVVATLVKLPPATEMLGQLRGRGAGALASGKLSAEDKAVLAGLARAAADYHESMAAAFDKSFAARPALAAQLRAKVGGTVEPLQAAMKLVETQLLAPDTPQGSAADYFAALTRAIDQLVGLEEAALQPLEEQLADRASGLRWNQALQLGLSALLVLVAALMGRFIVRSITVALDEAVTLAARVAAGDLTYAAEIRGRDEIARLMTSLKDMQGGLQRVVGQVRDHAEGVAVASKQIAEGNSDLSRRTEQQAASLEETASSMEQLSGTVKQNAEHSSNANELAQRARELAERSGASVQRLVSAMSEMDAGSKRIADIIGVIDGIAFQTNILALNAAVEAARAGESGRGFAVVASEVRSLAGRSAAAAREIKSLIQTSLEQVETGTAVADEAGAHMSSAVQAIAEVAGALSQITHASREQSTGIGQVTQTVSHLDGITQQNASLVEQAAAASDSLRQQAQRLAEIVKVFRLEADAQAAA